MTRKSLWLLALGHLMGPTVTKAHSERTSFIAEHYGRPQMMIAVRNARRLNLVCVGAGKPTVLFLSGLGGGTFDWRKVQPAIGKITRACSYDRAGYGFSDPTDEQADVNHTLSDLHALLHAPPMAGPVVLIGHSLGGLYATAYTQRYPSDISGMVLVDPAFVGQARAIAQAVGIEAADRMATSNAQTMAALDRCVVLAMTGRLALPSHAKSECLDTPADPDPDVHRERDREAKGAGFQIALRSEFQAANIVDNNGKTADDLQSDGQIGGLGAIPLVVLTRGNRSDLPGVTVDELAMADAAWKDGHDRLAALSTNGRNYVVPRSGHFIQIDQPSAVVDKIAEIIDQVRRR